MPLITHPDSRRLIKSERATAMVFEDIQSRHLLQRIEQIAPSEASVLIIGDTGTGKELVARQVHALSRRCHAPFIAVNCGAFSESLAESELFGHEKGAFTGAINSKVGWFEAANGGTLFLDEIGDLSLSMQVKLLRVLQEREVVRVGSLKPIKLDVRVVAATNVRLEEAVRAGKFREDLFYRLHVASLDLLPLAARTGDILPLAYHFLSDYTQRLNYAHASISPRAEQVLLRHTWPGNIRELENAIHHALLVCKNHQIEPEDLRFSSLSGVAQKTSHIEMQPSLGSDYKKTLEQVLLKYFESPTNSTQVLDHELEEVVIRTAYEYCHRNQIQTAKLLGVSRNVVRARLLKHQLIGENIKRCANY